MRNTDDLKLSGSGGTGEKQLDFRSGKLKTVVFVKFRANRNGFRM